MHLLRRRQTETGVYGARYTQNQTIRGSRLLAVGSLLIILTASASAVALSRTDDGVPTTPVAVSTSSGNRAADLTTRTSPATDVTLVPTCARGTYNLPDSLDPTNLPDGIHYQIDQPVGYKVYGDSTAAINQQIYDCTPIVEGSRYAANTGFNLSSYYTYSPNGDGTCSIVRSSITLHTNQIYPEWVNTGTDTATSHAWDSFITNLRTHENGHIDFDKQYAQKMYEAVKGIQNIHCDSIDSVVKATIRSVVSALNSANDKYDAATDHGATQGASLL